MNCNTCGNELVEDAQFCDACGAEVENKQGETSGNEQIQVPKEKSGILKWIGIVAIAVVLLMGIAYLLLNLIFVKNPVDRTIIALGRLGARNEVNMTARVTTDGYDELDEFFENVETTISTTTDKRKQTSTTSIALSYDEDTVIDFLTYTEGELLYLDLPRVLEDDEYYYYDLSEFMEVDDDELTQIMEYFERIDVSDLNYQDYTEVIYEAADGDIEQDGNKVIYNINGKMLADVIEELVEFAEDDEELPEWIQENGIKVLEEMEEDEFELDSLDEDDIEELRESFEDDFMDDWEEVIDDISDDMDDTKDEIEYLMEDVEIEVVFTFGIFGNMKEMDVEFEMYDQSILVSFDLTEGVKTPRKYNEDDGRDIEKFDEDDLEDVTDDTKDYLEDYLEEHEDFEEYLDDLMDDLDMEGVDSEYFLGMLVEEVFKTIYGELSWLSY